jgi:hypothetical protein
VVESPPRRGVRVASADKRGADSEALEAPPQWGTRGEERCIAKQFPMAPVTAAGGQGGPVNWEEPRATKKGNVPEGRGVLGGLGTPRVMDPARA